ncbi:hypothetical protein B296_00016624 [Ensete ventricosum]|uniref:Uncharacterized protein n=1 Tax=Ensete ventricosum TaxID=4639 RepID=A0A427ASK0_ENSVE|nr:hypothetical protein B296_00016624 [Ensete ventricosum]
MRNVTTRAEVQRRTPNPGGPFGSGNHRRRNADVTHDLTRQNLLRRIAHGPKFVWVYVHTVQIVLSQWVHGRFTQS